MRRVFHLGSERFQFLKFKLRDMVLDTRRMALVADHCVVLAVACPKDEIMMLQGVCQFFVHALRWQNESRVATRHDLGHGVEGFQNTAWSPRSGAMSPLTRAA